MRKLTGYLIILILLFIPFSVYAIDTGESAVTQITSLQVFTGPLDAVAFSRDGSLLASGGRDNTVRLWDVSSGENILTLTGHDDWVTSVTFNPQRNVLASGSRDNTVRLWDIQTGQLIRVIGNHSEDVTSLAFTPDGAILASGARDGAIKLHHLTSGSEIAVLDNYGGPVWDIRFSPNGEILASGSEDGVVWLWGLWDEDGVWLRQLEGHDGPVASLAFSGAGDRLISGGLDNTLRVWDISRVEDDSANLAPEAVIHGHLAPIMGVGFTSDARVAASASLDGTVRLWDIDGAIQIGTQLATITGNGAPLTHLALDPTYTTAASVGTDGVLNLWDVGEHTIEHIIESNRPASIIEAPPTTAVASTTMIDPAPRSPINPEDRPSATAPSTGRVLSIPSVDILSAITTFHLDGVSWAIDPWEASVGHLQGTAWMDRVGNMVLGGHSEYPNGSPGVFNALYDIGIGDEIFVRDGAQERRYVVVNILKVDYTDLSVVYPTDHNRLTLITCDIPSYVAESNTYYERLVVIAHEL